MKSILLLLPLLLSGYIKGQNIDIGGLFPTIDHSGTISDRFDYSLYYFGGLNMLHSRASGIGTDPNFFVLYLEQALTYKASANLSYTGSYVYERQHPTENNYRNENRFYLQSTYKYNLNRNTLKHRLRYDGRFIENRATGKSPYESRIRYLFGVKSPVKKESDKMYFAAYNEFFFNLDRSATAIYAENWAFAGIGFKTPGAGTFEVGPLYIFWVADKQNNLINFYYLQLAWVTHLDFRKNK